MDPTQMLSQLAASRNPLQLLQQMAGDNPAFSRAMQMAQGKTPQQLEQTCRNLCQQQGVDFDQFMQTFSRFSGFR